MSVETASILSFATNKLLAPTKLAVPFQTASQTLSRATSSTSPDDRAQQAITAVKQANANWRGLRKSMAGFRLQYAQAALKALMFFGGDPVMVAKRAAQLAREVRAATQEYVAAGGDAADVPVMAQPATADANATPAVPSASTPVTGTGMSGFADQAKTTLDILKAIVTRNHHAAKGDQQHRQALAAFDTAANDADAAVDRVTGAASTLFDTLNLLI